MDDQPRGVVIDAALRFARSNPAVLAFAQEHARRAGRSVDDLLIEAIGRLAAAREAFDEEVGPAPREGAAGA